MGSDNMKRGEQCFFGTQKESLSILSTYLVSHISAHRETPTQSRARLLVVLLQKNEKEGPEEETCRGFSGSKPSSGVDFLKPSCLTVFFWAFVVYTVLCLVIVVVVMMHLCVWFGLAQPALILSLVARSSSTPKIVTGPLDGRGSGLEGVRLASMCCERASVSTCG